MDAIRQYVVSVVSAAVLCGLASALLRKGPSHSLVKLICGTFLAFTFLRPIPELDLEQLAEPFLMDLEEGRAASEEGAELARDSMSTIIKERTISYILDKARALGVTVQVDVILSEDTVPSPVGVVITGAVSPYEKKQLEEHIQKELGISPEEQRWIS